MVYWSTLWKSMYHHISKLQCSRVEIILGTQRQNWFAKILIHTKDSLNICNFKEVEGFYSASSNV